MSQMQIDLLCSATMRSFYLFESLRLLHDRFALHTSKSIRNFGKPCLLHWTGSTAKENQSPEIVFVLARGEAGSLLARFVLFPV